MSSIATRISEYIKPKLNRRSVAFTACLALSALFWLLTSLSKEYVDEILIPVSYQDVPEDLLIVNELETEVQAEAKGFGFNLLWYFLNLEHVEIQINANPDNLSRLTRNGEEIHFYLTKGKSKSLFEDQDDQLQIQDISPDTLYIKFKKKYSKLVPVKLNADITFDKQYGMIEDAKIEPDSVLVSGLKEEIDTIKFVVVEPQNWTDLDESLTAEVPLVKYENSPLVELSETQVSVELNVVEFTEGTASIPLNIVSQKPGSVKVFPSIVEITYQVPLAAYDDVNAAQFQASVVLDELETSQTRLSVNIDRHPEFVKSVRVNPSQVEFIIQK
ncbi:MAG: CdaR family protein [Flavobacteriales bacterium]